MSSSPYVIDELVPERSPIWPGAVVACVGCVGLWYAYAQMDLPAWPALLVQRSLWPIHALWLFYLTTLFIERHRTASWSKAVKVQFATESSNDTWGTKAYQLCVQRAAEKLSARDPDRAAQVIRANCGHLDRVLMARCQFYAVGAFVLSALGAVMFGLQLWERTNAVPFGELFLICGTALIEGTIVFAFAASLSARLSKVLDDWCLQACAFAGIDWQTAKSDDQAEEPDDDYYDLHGVETAPYDNAPSPNEPYRQFHGQTDRQLDETQLRTPEGPDDAGPAKPPLKAQPVPPGERETKTILPLPPPDDPSDKPKEPNDKPKKRDPYDILRKRKGPSR